MFASPDRGAAFRETSVLLAEQLQPVLDEVEAHAAGFLLDHAGKAALFVEFDNLAARDVNQVGMSHPARALVARLAVAEYVARDEPADARLFSAR